MNFKKDAFFPEEDIESKFWCFGDGPGDAPGGDAPDDDADMDAEGDQQGAVGNSSAGTPSNDDSGYGFDDVNFDPAPPPGTNPGGAPNDMGLDPDDSGFFGSMLDHALDNPFSTLANFAINLNPIGLAANLGSMALTGNSIASNVATAIGNPTTGPSPTAEAVSGFVDSFGNPASNPMASTPTESPASTTTASTPTESPAGAFGGFSDLGGRDAPGVPQTSIPTFQPFQQTSIPTVEIPPLSQMTSGYTYNPLPNTAGYSRVGAPLNLLGHRFFV